MKWWWVLVAVVMGAVDAYGQPSASISVVDGLADKEVKNGFQDRDGYLWFSTTAGLCRYDGKEFVKYGRAQGLSSSDVRLPFEDSKRRLWFYMEDHSFGFVHHGSVHTAQTDPWLAKMVFPNEARPHSMVEDKSGRIWACNSQQYLFLEGAAITSGVLPGSGEGRFGRLVTQHDGTVHWVGTGEILRWADSSWVHQECKYVPQEESFFASAKGDTILFLSEAGIVMRVGSEEHLLLNKEFCPDSVVNILLDHSNRLLVLDQAGKLWVSQQNQLGKYGRCSAVPQTATIERLLLEDDEHNLWVVQTNKGLSIIKQGLNDTYQINDGNLLAKNEVTAMVMDGDSNLLVGNSTGLIQVLNIKSQPPIVLGEIQIGRKAIRGLLPNPDGYVITTDTGIYVWKYTNIADQTSSAPEIAFESRLQIHDFHSYIDGAFSFLSGGTVHWWNLNSNQTSGMIELPEKEMLTKYCHVIGMDGTLWLGTASGLCSWRTGEDSIQWLGTDNIYSKVTSIVAISGDTVAVATSEQGVFICDRSKILAHLTIKDGLPSESCRILFLDGKSLWVSTTKGIAEFRYEADRIVQGRLLERSDGLPTTYLDHLIACKGSVFAASELGITIVPSTSGGTKNTPPRLHLLSQEMGGKAMKDKETYPSNQNDLEVRFLGISFSEPDVNYRYRLQGIHESPQWEETHTPQVSYPDLHPGHYVFEVQTRINHEPWSNSLGFEFTIKQPFWQSLWFIILVLLLLMGMAYLLFQWRIQTARRKIHAKLINQNRISRLEMQATQAMMNPHFIFNVMNSIRHFMHLHDTENAEAYLNRFAKLVRKNLDMLAKTLIPIDEEIAFIGDYVAIEALRFQGKLQWSIEAADEIANADIMIPVMIVQPFVENAIWHGLLPNNDASKLRVEFILLKDESLVVEISDNGAGMMHKRGDADHVGKGLSLTQERLRLLGSLSGKEIRVEYGASEPKNKLRPGTLVRITFPKDFETAVNSADIGENGNINQ